MKTSYPAVLTFSEEDQSFLVEFPDLPGCLTEGKTIDEALAMAKEALTGYLESVMDRGIELPSPSVLTGAISIDPEPSVAFALRLRSIRAKSGKTLTEVADAMGVKYQVYQKLENPQISNPTLKTIKKIEKVFEVQLLEI